MKSGWQLNKLGDVCRFIGGSQPPKSVFSKTEKADYIRLIQIRDYKSDNHKVFIPIKEARRYCGVNDVMIGRYGPPLFQILRGLEGAYNVALMKAVPDESKLSRDFLFYFLNSPKIQHHVISSSDRAAGQTGLNKETIEPFPILLPPLHEQHRIVGILDKAFEGITIAKANAEKNVQNARSLFKTKVQNVFTIGGKGWVEKSILECFKVTSGDFLPTKNMVLTGNYDVYGGNGITGKHNQKNLSGENIIIGRVGAKCGNVRRVTGDIWLTDNAFYISDFYEDFDLSFLAQLLEQTQLRDTANQAAQPVISYSTIKGVLLKFPKDKSEQSRIAKHIKRLEEESQSLAAICNQKLALLNELKKSLLYEAFS